MRLRLGRFEVLFKYFGAKHDGVEPRSGYWNRSGERCGLFEGAAMFLVSGIYVSSYKEDMFVLFRQGNF